MSNLYMHKGKWVTADQLRELRDGNKEIVVKVKEVVTEEVKEDMEALRLKYKQVHPEGKGVPPAWMNKADKIKEKIAEFTK